MHVSQCINIFKHAFTGACAWRHENSIVFLSPSPLTYLGQGCSLNLGLVFPWLGWLPASLSNLSVSASRTGVISMLSTPNLLYGPCEPSSRSLDYQKLLLTTEQSRWLAQFFICHMAAKFTWKIAIRFSINIQFEYTKSFPLMDNSTLISPSFQ